MSRGREAGHLECCRSIAAASQIHVLLANQLQLLSALLLLLAANIIAAAANDGDSSVKPFDFLVSNVDAVGHTDVLLLLLLLPCTAAAAAAARFTTSRLAGGQQPLW
jgi:hypothetical protein